MVLVKKFLSCCSLEIGGIVLGFLGTVRGFVELFIVIMIPFLLPKQDYEDAKKSGKLIFMYTFLGIGSVTDVVISCLLIIGAIKEKHLLIAPWLISHFIEIIFTGLIIIGSIIASIHLPFPFMLYLAGISMLSLGISVYLWICMLSLYKKLKSISMPSRLKEEFPSAPVYDYMATMV